LRIRRNPGPVTEPRETESEIGEQTFMLSWLYRIFGYNGACQLCGRFYCDERAKRGPAAHIVWPEAPEVE